jgi:hypothetical protein
MILIKGKSMTFEQLLTMFSARVICTYTPEQYADCVREARANRHRWGLGQW